MRPAKLPIILFITGVIFLFYVDSFAQPRLSFERIEISKGISEPRVRCFLQDSKGFIWIGTEDRLVRNQPHDPIWETDGHSAGIIPQMAIDILEDEKGQIWFCGRGLLRYDPATKALKQYLIYDSDASGSVNFIHHIFLDSRKRLWVGSYFSGLFLFDREKETFLSAPPDFPEGHLAVRSKRIKSILEDARGRLWFLFF